MKVEADAAQHLAKVVVLFKSKLWRDVADGEQLLCSKYIIGRMAIYQAAFYGEDAEEQSA